MLNNGDVYLELKFCSDKERLERTWGIFNSFWAALFERQFATSYSTR